MKKKNGATGARKPRLVTGIGRFIIDALAFGSRVLIGEDLFGRK